MSTPSLGINMNELNEEETKNSSDSAGIKEETRNSLFCQAPTVLYPKPLPQDRRKYCVMRLENGMAVVLVEDPLEMQSKVTLDVGAGSFLEPKEYPGLAHFLEHMLIKGGSTNFPEPGLFHKSIKSRNGELNGETSEEYTRYWFSIPSEYFEESLDMFVNFIKDPILKLELATNEIEAIENEFVLGCDMDARRVSLTLRHILDEEHAARPIHGGNKKTLPLEKMTEIAVLLRKFWEEYYTADRMTLLITSPKSLDIQVGMVKKHFDSIRKSKTPKLNSTPMPRFSQKNLQKQITIEKIKNSYLLWLKFIFTEDFSIESIQALNFIEYLLKSKASGSLLHALKRTGYIHDSFIQSFGIMTNSIYIAQNQVELDLQIPLTLVGASNIDKITIMVLEYIEFIKGHGIDAHIFKEFQQTSYRKFNFEADTIKPDYLYNIKNLPPNLLLHGTEILPESPFCAEKIANILDCLTPRNLLQVLSIGKDLITEAWREAASLEPYTNTRYSVQDLSSRILYWKPRKYLKFQLTEPNIYIPENFDIVDLDPKFKIPNLIVNENGLLIWLSQDHRFKSPKLETHIVLATPHMNDSAENFACFAILEKLLLKQIQILYTQFYRHASFTVSPPSKRGRGIAMTVKGYSHKQLDFILAIFAVIATFKIDAKAFETEKSLLIGTTLGQKNESLYTQAPEYLANLSLKTHYKLDDIRTELEMQTLESVSLYLDNMMKTLTLEIFCHGNITRQSLSSFGESATKMLNLGRQCAPQYQCLPIDCPKGGILGYRVETMQQNDSVLLFLRAPDDSLLSGFAIFLLCKMINPYLYRSLRDREQLAYLLACNLAIRENVHFIQFIIVSSNYSADFLVARFYKFLVEFKDVLEKMSEKEFNDLKKSLSDAHKKRYDAPRTPDDYCGLFVAEFFNGQNRFEEMFQNQFEKMTLKMIQDLYQEITHPHTRRQFLVLEKGSMTKNLPNLTDLDIEGFNRTVSWIDNMRIFKSNATHLPDTMTLRNRYLSIHRFNFPRASEHEDKPLVDEEDLRQALQVTSLVNEHNTVETLLCYCFAHYKGNSFADSSLSQKWESRKLSKLS